jgi:hypothetical protein
MFPKMVSGRYLLFKHGKFAIIKNPLRKYLKGLSIVTMQGMNP